jgi:RNA polymerase sigma-70 factor (ECF subfamily)
MHWLECRKKVSLLEMSRLMSPFGLLLKMAEDRPPEGAPSSSPSLSPPETVGAKPDVHQSVIENEVVRLYEKNAAALLRYGLAICGDPAMAQDAVQEAFLRYYIALRKETAGMDAKGWLYSTTRNYILDRLKEYYVRNSQSLEAASQIAEDAGNPEANIMLREIHATAQELLSPRELECLLLRNEGLRYRDIADILKIESATVGVLLGRALKKIRTALNRQENGK